MGIRRLLHEWLFWVQAIWGYPWVRFRWAWLITAFCSFLLIFVQGVVTGFETSLFESISKYSGLLWVRRWIQQDQLKSLENQLRKISHDPELRAHGFWSFEGILILNSQQVRSVLIQVLPDELWTSYWRIPQLRILVGKGISPLPDAHLNVIIFTGQVRQWNRKMIRLGPIQVHDFGKWEFNERLVLVPLSLWSSAGESYWHGFMVTGQNADFWVRNRADWRALLPWEEALTWFDINSNLFQAIWIERWVILAIVNLVMVTSFFLSWVTLWILIIYRVRILSLLQVTGLSQKKIVLFSSVVGMVFGITSWMAGAGLAWGASTFWEYFFGRWPLWPDEVYRISFPRLAWNARDWIVSFVWVFSLSLLSFSGIVGWVMRRQSLSQALRFE